MNKTAADRAVLRRFGDVECLVNAPVQPTARLVLAHGAGAPMDSDFMTRMAELLCEQNLEVVRFEFPYMARRRQSGKKSPPDRQPVLLETWRRLIEALAAEKENLPLFIGGKSMGGRMATVCAAEYPTAASSPVKGVVCLGYPFHPPGKPEKLRTEHLLDIKTPTLIVQGTRDTMGNWDEVVSYPLSTAVLLAWLDMANHDLKPLRASGHSHDQHLTQAAERVAAFARLAC